MGDHAVHRVIQWGTGNVGFHSLRHIIRHPNLELVGVHAHGQEKIGELSIGGAMTGKKKRGKRGSAKGTPGYLRHRDKKRGDRAFVLLEGKRVYLGKYGSPESR